MKELQSDTCKKRKKEPKRKEKEKTQSHIERNSNKGFMKQIF